jgi:hypothetical protein
MSFSPGFLRFQEGAMGNRTSGATKISSLRRRVTVTFGALRRRQVLRHKSSTEKSALRFRQWGKARKTGADGPREGWALLTPEAFADPQRPPRDYGRRPTLAERPRQLKGFYDLTDFPSRSFNGVAAQGVFVLRRAHLDTTTTISAPTGLDANSRR